MTTRASGSSPCVRLVIFGDFNCPFSALASARAARLEHRGIAVVEWRAVDHDQTIPATGEPVSDDQAAGFERELADIRGLLVGDEPDRLRAPTMRCNTGLVTATFAAVPAREQTALRQRLFAAYWEHGANLSDADVVQRLAGPRVDERTARRWRDEWQSLAKPIVPVMVLPDGYVSRGLGALGRLRQLLDDPPVAVHR